jgi:hypothetical protein
MFFVLGFITGVVCSVALFVFSTWKRVEIQEVFQIVEDKFSETGGFIEPVDPDVKVANQLKAMLEE